MQGQLEEQAEGFILGIRESLIGYNISPTNHSL